MGFTGLQAGEGCMICTICWTGLPKGMQFWLGQPSGCADVAAQELAEQAAASGLQLSGAQSTALVTGQRTYQDSSG